MCVTVTCPGTGGAAPGAGQDGLGHHQAQGLWDPTLPLTGCGAGTGHSPSLCFTQLRWARGSFWHPPRMDGFGKGLWHSPARVGGTSLCPLFGDWDTWGWQLPWVPSPGARGEMPVGSSSLFSSTPPNPLQRPRGRAHVGCPPQRAFNAPWPPLPAPAGWTMLPGEGPACPSGPDEGGASPALGSAAAHLQRTSRNSLESISS